MGPFIDHRSPGSFADVLQADPEAWGLRINSAWRRSLESVIETGRLLIDAKANLVKRGQWESLITNHLDFSPDTAQRLMAIARDERLTNPAHVRFLPRSYSTLHLLTKVPDEQFARGIAENIINPDMERKDVEQLRPKPEPIPEPAESDDPDQNAAGGVLIPSMAAEQSGEQEAGETIAVSAGASSSPALLAPADPAAVEGAEQDAALHAPPASMPGGGLAIAHSRVEPTDSLDFFPTPPWATRALFEHVLKHLNRLGHCKYQSVLEPACGEGHMAEVLKEYFPMVIASDVKDYGGGYGVADFLDKDTWSNSDWIITNPPFGKNTNRFILKALDLAGTGVAMLVRMQCLETIDRYEQIFRDRPPTLISFFVERVPMHKGRWEPDGGTMTAYIWLVWLKGASPKAPFWIPPGCRDALTKPDDAARFGARSEDAA